MRRRDEEEGESRQEKQSDRGVRDDKDEEVKEEGRTRELRHSCYKFKKPNQPQPKFELSNSVVPEMAPCESGLGCILLSLQQNVQL